MKNLSLNLGFIALSCLFLTACGDSTQENSQNETANSSVAPPSKAKPQTLLSKQALSINWNGENRIPEQIQLEDPANTSTYIDGKFVKASTIPLEDFIKTNGKITLRKGKDFFADWSMKIDVENLMPNSTIELDDFNAKAEISAKKPKHNLPTSTFLTSVKGTLKTGKLTALGMAIQMHVEGKLGSKGAGEASYVIDGQGFATVGDIKIKDNKLDKHHDSFKTINIIAKYFLKDKARTTPFTSRHVMFSSDKGVGVEALQVYSYQDKNKHEKLVRVQLLKQADGWKAEKELAPWELLYSRKEGSEKNRDVINIITSKKIEALLKDKKIENHIDTSVSCRQSKDKTQALCTAKITVLQDDEKNCMTKAYSLAKNKQWTLLKEVATNLKLDYKTGNLVKKKKKKKSLEEKLFKSATGFLFGKCSGF